jgi:hypothetical protein
MMNTMDPSDTSLSMASQQAAQPIALAMIVQNAILFQIGWFACVLSAANNLAWLGSLAAAGILTIHLRRAVDCITEMKMIALVTVIGILWDSALMRTEFYQFTDGVLIAGIVPYWLIALWAVFATTLNLSLRWLKHRKILAAALGFIAGPASYYAGHMLGAIEFSNTTMALMLTAIGWAVILPLIMTISEHFDGYRLKEVK